MRKWLLSIASIALIAVLILILTLNWPARGVAQRLTVRDDNLNFGTVPARESFDWNLSVTNQSSAPVTVDRIRTSCSCTATGEKTLSFAPGETRQLHLTLNLTGNPNYSAPSRPFSVSVYLDSQAQNQSQHWIVEGRVEDLFLILPSSVDLGQSLRGQRSAKKRLSISSKVPLRKLTEVTSSDVSVSEVSGSSNKDFTFEIDAAPQKSVGMAKFHLLFNAISDDGRESQIPVYAYCTVVDEIGCSPDSPMLGTGRPGEKLVFRRKLFSRSGIRHKIDGVAVAANSDSIKVEPRVESPDVLELIVDVVKPGLHEFEVKLDWKPLVDLKSPPTASGQSHLKFRCVGLNALK